MGLFDIFKNSSPPPRSKVSGVDKALALIKHRSELYPDSENYGEGGLHGNFLNRVARTPLHPRYLKWLVFNLDILRTVINNLKTKIFIKGSVIEPAYVCKCTNPECNKVFDYEAKECDVCGSGVGTPDWQNRKLLNKFVGNCNEYGQTLEQVGQEFEEDLETYDNGILLFRFEYSLNEATGEIIGRKLDSVQAITPVNLEKMISYDGRIGHTYGGDKIRTCIIHREVETSEDKCPQCGMRTHPVFFRETFGKKVKRFIPGEILHRTKYTSTKRMGYSNIYAIWKKLYTLYFQDELLMKSYQEGRPPKGMVIFNIMHEKLKKISAEVQSLLRKNPSAVPFIGMETQGRKMSEYINLLGTSEEQQLVEHRQELRRMVGALYGIMPVFSGDIQGSGGLNSEGQQIVVSNDFIKRGQDLINDVYSEVVSTLGIEDWTFTLCPHQDKDKMKEEQIELAKAQRASVMQSLGFEVFRDAEGNFQFSEEVTTPPQRNDDSSGISPPIKNPSSRGFDMGSLFSQGKEIEKADDPVTQKVLDDAKSHLGLKKKELTAEDVYKLEKYLIEKLGENAEEAIQDSMDTIYKETLEGIEKEMNQNVLFGSKDKELLASLKNNKFFQEGMKDLKKEQREKLADIFEEYHSDAELDPRKLKEKIAELVEFSENRIDLIVRNEEHKIANAARTRAYEEFDTEGEFKFRWAGPDDHRTTELCKKISDLTREGVSMKELQEIVISEARKRNPGWRVDPVTLLPHANCRHKPLRVR